MRVANIQTEYDLSVSASNDELFNLSSHAEVRMAQRNIHLDQLQLVLQHGKMIRSRRARFYVIGKKEVKRLAAMGIEIKGLQNIQVVVDEKTNLILTVYKNEDFRQIRPKHRREKRMQ